MRRELDSDAAGDLIGGIGEPIAADVTRVLFAQVLGLRAASDTGDDTLVNIARLIP
jgi:hypothetical protein